MLTTVNFLEIQDEEYKGKYYPFIATSLNELYLPGNLSFDPSLWIPIDIMVNRFDPIQSKGWISEAESKNRAIYNVIYNNSRPLENKTIYFRSASNDVNQTYSLIGGRMILNRSHPIIEYRTNFKYYSFPNITIPKKGNLVYFVLEAEEQNFENKESKIKILLNKLSGQRVDFIVENTNTYSVPEYDNLIYLDSLQLLVNKQGVAVGTADLVEELYSAETHRSTKRITNYRNVIRAENVRDIERIGIFIPPETIVEIETELEDETGTYGLNKEYKPYFEYRKGSDKTILLFLHTPSNLIPGINQVNPDGTLSRINRGEQGPTFDPSNINAPIITQEFNPDGTVKKFEKDKMTLLSPIPDWRKNYRIIATNWIYFNQYDKMDSNRYIKVYQKLMEEYGMYNRQFDLRNNSTQEYGYQDSDSDSLHFFKNYIKENPKIVDEHFVNKMLSKESPYNLTGNTKFDMQILVLLDIDDLVYASDFNESIEKIINTEEFVKFYLEERGYPHNLLSDIAVNESYFDFLIHLMNFIKSVKQGFITGASIRFHNTVKYFIMKTNYFDGKIDFFIQLNSIINWKDDELFAYVFDNDMYQFDENQRDKELESILEQILLRGTVGMLDYFVQKFHLTITNGQFFNNKRRVMIQHLVKKYDLPSE